MQSVFTKALVGVIAAIAMAACQVLRPPMAESSSVVIPLNHLPALRGDYFRLDSSILHRPFHIYVRLPVGYEKDRNSRYPTVYLLDGDSLFPILAANHLFLNYDEGVPEAIVIGIAYGSFDPRSNKRDFDFSAPAADAEPGQGGAPAFLTFLKSELIPKIEMRYRSNPERRVLFGQSRGGYLVLYSAFTDPDLFWGRIASNPSFTPGRERFYADPSPATKSDLGLVVTSGTRNPSKGRDAAVAWFKAWENRPAPWALKTADIQGGTHAANSTDSYRIGMIWLFGRNHELTNAPE